VVLVVDYTDGPTAADLRIADRLRRDGKSVTVAVNKSEGVASELAEAEFHSLGLGAPAGISALRGQGVSRLIAAVLAPLPVAEREDPSGLPRIAVIGRPNVGKSTLINRLIGAERLVTSPLPGTTRDSVTVPCERDGFQFLLVDTAGMRRRARVDDRVEKFSIVQSLRALDEAGAAVVLLDAREGLSDQDLHLIGLAVRRGSALVIGINKWDHMTIAARRRVEAEAERKLSFVPYARLCYLSALHGSGISELVRAAMRAYAAAGREMPTPRLNEVLSDALRAHPPPLVRGRALKLRYAHQGGRYPPLIIIHGSQATLTPSQYRRYLENSFRDVMQLEGTPLRIEFRQGENPFAGRRNRLSPRQEKRRKRVIRHSRR
jgi:GTP-binding protein